MMLSENSGINFKIKKKKLNSKDNKLDRAM